MVTLISFSQSFDLPEPTENPYMSIDSIKKKPFKIAVNELEKIPFPNLSVTKPTRPLIKRIIRKIFGIRSDIVNQIQKIAKTQQIESTNSKTIPIIIKSLKSIDYPTLKNDLKSIIKKLEGAEKEELLKQVLNFDFEYEQKTLGNRCINLLSLEDLRVMATNISQDFKNVETLASKLNLTFETIKKLDLNDKALLVNKKKTFAVFRMIGNFFHTIAVAFKLLNLNKEPNTYFETKYMLDIYWLLLDVPLKIIKFIFNLFVSPLKSLLVIILGTAITTIAGVILSKLSKRVPKTLPECDNLIDKIKRGKTKPSFGREDEVESIIQALDSQTDSSRKHPMILGKKGVGKTTLMDQLAHRFSKDDVPSGLKGKKLFYLNAAILKNKSSEFNLRTPIQKIMDKIGAHRDRIILIIDEAHNLTGLLGEQFKSLLDTSSKSLPYVIGITTSEDYQKCIKTNINKDDPENSLTRRFRIITMNEPNEKQTKRILSHVIQKEAEDISISRKILRYVFKKTNENIDDLNQPDKSVYILSNAIAKLRAEQNGKAIIALKQKKISKKASYVSRLSQLNLHARSISSEQVKKLEDKIELKDSEITKLDDQIKEIKDIANRYKKLIDLQTWHRNWLSSISKKISKESKTKKTPEILEKSYLFNSFFILPVLEEYIEKFKTQMNFSSILTKEMIDESINDYLTNS